MGKYEWLINMLMVCLLIKNLNEVILEWDGTGMGNGNHNKFFTLLWELESEWTLLPLMYLLCLRIRIDCCKLLNWP